jgi:hypothetical protein
MSMDNITRTEKGMYYRVWFTYNPEIVQDIKRIKDLPEAQHWLFWCRNKKYWRVTANSTTKQFLEQFAERWNLKIDPQIFQL